MYWRIEDLLREARPDNEADLFEPIVLTEAGRTFLSEFRLHALDEMARIQNLLDIGDLTQAGWAALLEDRDKYHDLASEIEAEVTKPDTRFTEFVKVGETESYATFGHRVDGEWEYINIDWSVWDLLGNPQVLKILKEK